MSITAHENGTESHEPGLATTEEGLRQEAIASLKRKRKFAEDLLAYVAVNGALWVIWALSDRGDDPFPWPVWVSAIWGVFLAVDAWRTFGPWPSSLRPITEEDVERELERSRTRGAPRA